MLSRIFLRPAGRFWAALLMLTIACHAAAPFEAPLAARGGSAFGAVTADVVVAPVRRAAVQLVAEMPVPPPPLRVAPILALPVVPVMLAVAHRWPDSTGPPRIAPIARKIAPRGPPSA